MKKITEEEYRQLKDRFDFTDKVLTLEIGERLFISRREWTWEGKKRIVPPYSLLRNHSKLPNSRLYGRKYSVESRQDGWIITYEGVSST